MSNKGKFVRLTICMVNLLLNYKSNDLSYAHELIKREEEEDDYV